MMIFFSFGNLRTYRVVCLSSFHFCLLYIYCLNLFQAREKKKAQTYQCLIDVPIIKIHLLYLSIKMLMFQLYFNVNLTWWNAIIMKFWMPYGFAWTCIQFQLYVLFHTCKCTSMQEATICKMDFVFKGWFCSSALLNFNILHSVWFEVNNTENVDALPENCFEEEDNE